MVRIDVDVATEVALRRLAVEYAAAVDHRDRDRFVNVFAHDATLVVVDVSRPDAPGRPMEGHEAIGKVTTKIAVYARTSHVLGQSIYWTESASPGDEASGEVWCIANHLAVADDAFGGAPSNTVMYIRYQDRYRRADEGWRIQSREVHVDWTERRALDSR